MLQANDLCQYPQHSIPTTFTFLLLSFSQSFCTPDCVKIQRCLVYSVITGSPILQAVTSNSFLATWAKILLNLCTNEVFPSACLK